LLLRNDLGVGYYAFARPLWCAWHYLDFKRSYGSLKIFISLRCSSHANSTTANINPFRYRGYYYDVETGLYYLQSRYYDPEIGRWINADGYVSTGQELLGFNMFVYCGNNPVSRILCGKLILGDGRKNTELAKKQNSGH